MKEVALEHAPLIPTTFLAAAHNVSSRTVGRVVGELERRGCIAPVRTPTGRTIMTFAEAALVSRELRLAQ